MTPGNKWVAKENKEIRASSLQSAYDPDATYRKKGNKDHVGYVVNIAETCSQENPVQLITDYTLEKNSKSDAVEMLKVLFGKLNGHKDVKIFGHEIVIRMNRFGTSVSLFC